VALTWGVSRYALDIPWKLFVGEHIGGVAHDDVEAIELVPQG